MYHKEIEHEGMDWFRKGGRLHEFVLCSALLRVCLIIDLNSTWAEAEHSREEGSRHSDEQKSNLATQHGPFPQQHRLTSTQQANLHASSNQKTAFCKNELKYLSAKKLKRGEDNRAYLVILNVCISSDVIVVLVWSNHCLHKKEV
jgi:hypothetical protein